MGWFDQAFPDAPANNPALWSAPAPAPAPAPTPQVDQAAQAIYQGTATPQQIATVDSAMNNGYNFNPPGFSMDPNNPSNFAPDILPDSIRNSKEYQALSAESKTILEHTWKAARADDALLKIRAREALAEAIKIASPALKQSLLLAKDASDRDLSTYLSTNKNALDKLNMELENKKQDLITNSGRLNAASIEEKLKDMESISTIKDAAIREGSSREAGVAAELARTQRHIDAISEDLKTGKQDISIEEQATLARQLRDYQRNLQTAQESAVDAGMGFSSIRAEAEKRLSEDLADVTESTKRQSARQTRLLETSSGRDTTELLASEAEVNRKNQEARVTLAREMEQKMGYAAVPDTLKQYLPAPLTLDNGTVVRGEAAQRQQERDLELQQKQQDIDTQTKRAEADAERQRKALEKEREQNVLAIARAKEKAVGTEGLTAADTALATPLGGIVGTEQQKNQELVLNTQNAILGSKLPADSTVATPATPTPWFDDAVRKGLI